MIQALIEVEYDQLKSQKGNNQRSQSPRHSLISPDQPVTAQTNEKHN